MVHLDLILNPETLMSDFETGLLPALCPHFPNGAVRGCYFPHTKVIWAKDQEFGLVPDFNSNPEVKKFIQKLMALAFLPILLVR